jgi:hypothetical protein
LVFWQYKERKPKLQNMATPTTKLNGEFVYREITANHVLVGRKP